MHVLSRMTVGGAVPRHAGNVRDSFRGQDLRTVTQLTGYSEVFDRRPETCSSGEQNRLDICARRIAFDREPRPRGIRTQ